MASPLIPRGSVFSFLLDETPAAAIAAPINEAFRESLASSISTYLVKCTYRFLGDGNIPVKINAATERIESLLKVLVSHDWERHYDLEAIEEAVRGFNRKAVPNPEHLRVFKDRSALIGEIRKEVSGIVSRLRENSMFSEESNLTKESTVFEYDSIFNHVGIDLDKVAKLSLRDVHFLIESQAQFEWGFRPGLFDIDPAHEEMLETLSRHPLTLFGRSQYQQQFWKKGATDLHQKLLEKFNRNDIPLETYSPEQLEEIVDFSKRIRAAAMTPDGIEVNAERFSFAELEESLNETAKIINDIRVQADQREANCQKRRIERLGYSFMHPAWLGNVWQVAVENVHFEDEAIMPYGLIIDTDHPSP